MLVSQALFHGLHHAGLRLSAGSPATDGAQQLVHVSRAFQDGYGDEGAAVCMRRARQTRLPQPRNLPVGSGHVRRFRIKQV